LKNFQPKQTKIGSAVATETATAKTPATEKMTMMGSKTNIAENIKSIRLTDDELALLNNWISELQQRTNKKLSASKLIRGLLHMQDGINQSKLIDAIHKNT